MQNRKRRSSLGLYGPRVFSSQGRGNTGHVWQKHRLDHPEYGDSLNSTLQVRGEPAGQY